MKRVVEFIKSEYLVILGTFLVCALLLIVPINSLTSTIKEYNPISLKDILEKENISEENIKEKNVINDDIVNIIYTSDSNISKSLFYSEKLKDEVNYTSLIKNEYIKDFDLTINNLIDLKYPEFISSVLKDKNKGIYTYRWLENELQVYFYNFEINPKIDEELFIRVNYNEIKEYINFEPEIDLEYENENGFNYDVNKKTVALSFDDGPNGERTKKLLNILKANKAHATFFMVGNKLEMQKDVVLEVFNSDNEIGSHSYKHENLGRQTAEERQIDLLKTDEIYKSITGENFKLFRPPYGAFKKEMLNEFNYAFILWNIDTLDWQSRNKDKIIAETLNNLSDGSIILMHDSYDTTVEAVSELLPILYSKGYQVVTVSQLASLKGQTINVQTSYRNFK